MSAGAEAAAAAVVAATARAAAVAEVVARGIALGDTGNKWTVQLKATMTSLTLAALERLPGEWWSNVVLVSVSPWAMPPA